MRGLEATDATMTSLLCCVCVAVVCVATVTADGSLFVDVTHRESSTSSISIEWRVRDEYLYDVIEFMVETRKMDSAAVTRSEPLPVERRFYEIRDLSTNAGYEICVSGWKLANATVVDDNVSQRHCVEMATIPLIRTDSLVVLGISIGLVLLTIVAGYLCWRCAKARLERAAAKAGDGGDDDNNATNTNGYQPIEEPTVDKPSFLEPPPSQVIRRPRSTIEDDDIPYITPPLSELSDDSNKRATSNNFK